jgi:DNA-binding response OmpR family regulator
MPGKLILLIEQDDSIREVLMVCLRHLAGWTVLSYESSEDNLEQVVQDQPDAILLDTVMPRTSGLGFIQKLLIRKLRKYPMTSSTPIVLMTDKANWVTPKQLRSLGVNGTISKPFDPTTLPTQIANLLGWANEETNQ